MKKTMLFVTIALTVAVAHAQRSVPATWRHELSSTSLEGYQKGEFLIMSSIYTGTHGKDASKKYGLDVKVVAWNKPFTVTSISKDKKLKKC